MMNKEQTITNAPSADYTVEDIDALIKRLGEQHTQTVFVEPLVANATTLPLSSPEVIPDETVPDAEIEPVVESDAKQFAMQAQEKIESILNLRTFAAVLVGTVMLALYIYNVISINRLATETRQLEQQMSDAKNLNTTLESKLGALQRIERISKVAYEVLGLGVKGEQPIELKK